MVETGLIMLAIFLPVVLMVRKKLISGWVFVFYILCMIIPSILDVNYIKVYNNVTINYGHTVLLICLLTLGFIPWIKFDTSLKRIKNKRIELNPKYYTTLKIIIIFLITSGIYSILYVSPYALRSLTHGAGATRALLRSGELVLPNNIFTTISVGLAAFNIYSIMFFFLANILPSLRKYRIWLLVASMSNVVQAFAFTGRDQLVVAITFFIVFYLVFSNFLSPKLNRTIKRSIFVFGGFVFAMLLTFTLDRFSKGGSNNKDIMLRGTIGYISEQPYVFNTALEHPELNYGFERRFPLINDLTSTDSPVFKPRAMYQWQFATMYGEFFEMEGWTTLIFFSALFILFYSIGMTYLIRNRRYFGTMLLFCVYLYIQITGIFYIKAGGSPRVNIFYILLSIIPFFFKNLIFIKPKNTIK